jgi:hypothetical protein
VAEGLRFRMPLTCSTERHWLHSVVSGRVPALPIELEFEDRKTVLIEALGYPKFIEMPDILLANEAWPSISLSDTVLPVELPPPLSRAAVCDLVLPLPAELRGHGALWVEREDGAWLGVDVLGMLFLQLSLVEEAWSHATDHHARHPVGASWAGRANLLDRPLADEWLNVLFAAIRRLWPGLPIVPVETEPIRLSHDVDVPYMYAFMTPWRLTREVAAALLLKHNLPAIWTAPRSWLRVKRAGGETDPCFVFDWMLEESERRGLVSTFYFIAGHTAGLMDGDYDIGHPLIRSLLRRIHARGHKIGVHLSYNSKNDVSAMTKELSYLKRVCSEEGIVQPQWGSRQHYLRWDTPTTAQCLDTAGVDYDTTLTYAEHAGFRCGTSFDFPLFDASGRKSLRLVEKPLIAMECSVLDEPYQALGIEAGYEYFMKLRRRCEQTNGTFSLLWHNTRLLNPADRELYLSIIS